jgi:hypothetical protein
MTEPPPTLVADPPVVSCFHCEYDLRGLPRKGRCPECGSDIETSWQRTEARHHRGPLAIAWRRWLLSMAGGCVLLLAAAVSTLVYVVMVLHYVMGAAMVAMYFTPLALLAGGMWMLGAREPANPTTLNRALVRWFIRCAILLEVYLSIYGFYLGPGRAMANFTKGWFKVEGVVYAAAGALVLLRMADAARRLGHARLRAATILLLCIMPAAFAAQALSDLTIRMRRTESWFLTPHPVIGYVESIILVPFAPLNEVRIDLRWWRWAGEGLLSIAMLILLAASAWMFIGAARRRQRTLASSRP